MVVDHVEQHLDAGGMQSADHRLEFFHRFVGGFRRRIVLIGGEEGQRVVSPIVAKFLIDQMAIVAALINRQQFDRGDAQLLSDPSPRATSGRHKFPRSSSGTPGCSFVKPFTWIS